MATRFYEVTVIASKTVVVEVDDNGDEASKMEASNFAFHEAFSGCTNIDVDSVTHLKTEYEIEQSKRHADEVFEL